MGKTLSYRRILPFLLLLLTALGLEAQDIPEARYPYRREIAGGDFEKCAQKIAKKLAKDSLDIAYNYAAYQLWSASGNHARDLERAYGHLDISLGSYIHATPRQIDRLTRDGFDGTLFTYDLTRIGLMALGQARGQGTADAYSRLLSVYTEIPDSILAIATYSRDSIELAAAILAGRAEDFQAFLQRRPGSPLERQAVALRDSTAFADAQRTHTQTGYEQFLRDYPSSALHGRATDSLHTLAFRQAEEAGAEQFYRSYAERFPLSRYAATALYRADSIQYHTVTAGGDWRSYILYLDSAVPHPAVWDSLALHTLAALVLAGPAVDPVVQTLAHTPTTDAYYLPLAHRLRMDFLLPSVQNYHRLYGPYSYLLPESWRVQDSLALAAYENYDYHIVDSCIRAIAPYHEAYIMLQQLIDHDLRYGRASEALEKIAPYKEVFEGSEEYALLTKTLTKTKTGSLPTLNSQFSTLNSQLKLVAADCSHPVPTADGTTLYFSVKGHPTNIGGADIFSAKNRKGAVKTPSWSNARIEMDLSHTYGHEAPLSVTADGNTMLTLQSGRLIVVRRDSASRKWLPGEPLLPDFPRPIADASMTADGKAILLSLSGKESYQTDSSLNLYVLLLEKDTLIDLGPVVNTPFADKAPYLHTDMRTLYFASEGHGSMGQLDIFVVTRLNDERWDQWSEPVNLGIGINTVDNDAWLRLSPDGKTGYSHRRGLQWEIVVFPLITNH